VEIWIIPFDDAEEHRLEVYATLFPGLSSDLFRAIPGATSVYPE
jgi:hypothetical protein